MTTKFVNLILDTPELLRPNALLNIREEDGKIISVPIEIQSAAIDTTTGIVEYEVSPLEILTSNSGPSVTVKSIDETESSFGQITLFIDGLALPGSPCGDGAGIVCPLTSDAGLCLNTGAGPECCSLGDGVTCGSCICN